MFLLAFMAIANKTLIVVGPCSLIPSLFDEQMAPSHLPSSHLPSGRLAATKPGLFKMCLEVVQMLCMSSCTANPTLRALRQHNMLLDQLDELLFYDGHDLLTHLAARTFVLKILVRISMYSPILWSIRRSVLT